MLCQVDLNGGREFVAQTVVSAVCGLLNLVCLMPDLLTTDTQSSRFGKTREPQNWGTELLAAALGLGKMEAT